MKPMEITDNELLAYLKLSEDTELSGSYGRIITLSNSEILKIYYRLFKQDFNSCTAQDLKKDLEQIKKFSTNGVMSYKKFLADPERIKILIEKLNETSQKDLIKNYIVYEELVIALILTNYKDYETYEDLIINNNLTRNEHKYILEQIKEKVYELINTRLYPLDLKEDNIMVNRQTLDIKLIDLDDLGTIFLENNYPKSYKKSVDFKLDVLKHKVLRKL